MNERDLIGGKAHLLPKWAMRETSGFHRLMLGVVLSQKMRRTLRRIARELNVPHFQMKDLSRSNGSYETALLFSHGENDADFTPFIRLLKQLHMYVHIFYRDAVSKTPPDHGVVGDAANDNELVLSRPQAA